MNTEFMLENEWLAAGFDHTGRLVYLANKTAPFGNIIAQPAAGLFKIVARCGDNWENVMFAAQQELSIRHETNRLTIEIPRALIGAVRYNLRLTLGITLLDDHLCFDATIDNQADDLLVTDFYYPVIGQIRSLAGGQPDLIWPDQLGMRITNVTGRTENWKITYPGGWSRGASMQWLALVDQTQTLCLSGRDQMIYASELRADADAEEQTVTLQMLKLPFVKPAETWHSPEYLLSLYSGDWHRAAAEYREWVATWRRPVKPPDWVQNMTGYFLVINKQQYGEELWPYSTLEELYEYALINGCDTVGLFGWYDGGHDNTYPDIEPSPSMGGAAALRAGIRQIQSRGGHVTLYFQGHVMDISSPFYKQGGHSLEAKNRWGTPYIEQYNKSHNSDFLELYTCKTFAPVCDSCADWQDLLAEKTEYLNSFQPDGILFDQIGGMHPYPCFAAGHGHIQDKPSLAAVPGRRSVLDRLQRTTKGLDRNLAVLIEHVTDAYSGFADCLHGMHAAPGQPGYRQILNDRDKTTTIVNYPELFRYTFPETICTIRNPRSYISRRMANYAFVYGMPLEMELRYLDDKCSAQENRNAADREYACQLTRLRVKYREHMPPGRFLDEECLRNGNTAIVAKAFGNNDGIALALWNDSACAQDVKLNLPEYKIIMTAYIDGSTIDCLPEKLQPQQIALILCRQIPE